MAELYTYEVTRIHAKEAALLTRQDLYALASSKTYKAAVRYLNDKGIDGGGVYTDYGNIIKGENEKLWALIEELKIDKEKLNIFFVKKDFHNLKAAVKAVVSDTKADEIYLSGGSIPPETIEKAIKEKDYSLLPENMRDTAQKALTLLLQTGDGQKCDMLIDRKTLVAIYEAGEKSGDAVLKEYGEITVALADIKIAVRGNALSKSFDFMKEAMAECSALDISRLCASAEKSREELFKYLLTTPYQGAVAALKASYSELEKWCDNLIMEKISAQKFNPFTIAPIAAYIIARENELNAIRIILSGKANGLNEEFIRERLRETYV